MTHYKKTFVVQLYSSSHLENWSLFFCIRSYYLSCLPKVEKENRIAMNENKKLSKITCKKNPLGALIWTRLLSSDFLTISNVLDLPGVVETATTSIPFPLLFSPTNCLLKTLKWKVVSLSLHNYTKQRTPYILYVYISMKSKDIIYLKFQVITI